MKIRVAQIWGFLLTVLGWIFIACSMAMEGWKISSIGGQGGNSVITVGWYWSSLWRACYMDSTAVSNCYDFPVLWSVEDYIQIVRGLLMGGLAVGMLGFVLSLIGMECTYIGSNDKEKHRSLYVGGYCHVISGFSAGAGYAVYAQFISAEFFNPLFEGLKYDLGTPLFLGWAGCAFQMAGGIFYMVSLHKLWSQKEDVPVLVIPAEENKVPLSSRTDLSSISELSSKPPSSISSKAASKTSRGSRSARSGRSASPRGSLRTERSSRSSGSSRSSRASSSSSSTLISSYGGSSVPSERSLRNSYI